MPGRKNIHDRINQRLNSLPEMPARQAFVRDVQALISMDSDCSLPGITAQVWLDKLIDLPDSRFVDYARSYTPGLLDARKEHLYFTGRAD